MSPGHNQQSWEDHLFRDLGGLVLTRPFGLLFEFCQAKRQKWITQTLVFPCCCCVPDRRDRVEEPQIGWRHSR